MLAPSFPSPCYYACYALQEILLELDGNEFWWYTGDRFSTWQTKGKAGLQAALDALTDQVHVRFTLSFSTLSAILFLAGLAWAHLAAGDTNRARQEAERAQRMSADMGYHWGQVDAAEVLAALD